MAYYNFKYPFALAESQPSLMGEITVPSQQTPITPQPQQSSSPMGGGKNDKLALMLYALGGALRGDKNFMQNTLQLQQMQEGKKKQKEQEKAWEEWKDKNLNTLPESIRDLTDIVTAEQGINLAIKTATTPPKTISTAQRVSEIAARVANDPNYKLTKQDELILQISRKADPLTRGIEDISAEALSGFTQGKGTLQTYASTQDALNAGLKSGDQFKGTDGVTYRIP